MTRNLSFCAYYQTQGKPDGERGTCSFGCQTEPECITCEPDGGWPAAGEVDYHDAHDAYITAVANALEAAGFPVDHWYADPNDPRDGAICLDLEQQGTIDGQPIWSHDEVWVGWQEERGWTVLTVDEGKGWNKRDGVAEDARWVHDLNVPLVAAPRTVVLAVAEHAGLNIDFDPDDVRADVGFPSRSCEDEDPDFEAALAAYR